MDWCVYPDGAALDAAAQRYFRSCDEEGRLYGEAGLALALNVSLDELRAWYDGDRRPELQCAAQRAYLRIQSQIESGPPYLDKAMHSRAMFLLRQKRLGGYIDRPERADRDAHLEIRMGPNTDPTDFQ